MDNIDTTIHSVSDYLEWVKKTKTTQIKSDEGIALDYNNNDVYYRGHSCSCWKLKPSVLRDPYLDEHSLLKKASLRLSNEISSLNTYLEKMIF